MRGRGVPDLTGYGAVDVATFTGIPRGTVQDWLNRGLLPCDVVQHGNRTYRRFTNDHLRTIAVMKSFYAQGFEPAAARDFADRVERAMKDSVPVFFVLTKEAIKTAETGDALLSVRQSIGSDVFCVIDVNAVLTTLINIDRQIAYSLRKKK